MGQHYVPQHYLRHFATREDPNKIWMYDKCSKEFRRLPIKNVAQSSGFYSEEDERALSGGIESPAQVPLDQLRNCQQIAVEGRRAVAVYLDSMLKRGPRNRRKMIEKAPQTKNELLSEIRGSLELEASKFNLTPAELLHRVEQWGREYDSRPLSMRDDPIRRQWLSPRVVNCFFSMTWRVIKADDSHRFLTCDNPVFFDEGCGLKPPYGEFSFPLSSDVALHGCWQGPQEGLIFVQEKPAFVKALVKEIDRRVAFMADRFLFCHQNAKWVPVVAGKQRPELNRIFW